MVDRRPTAPGACRAPPVCRRVAGGPRPWQGGDLWAFRQKGIAGSGQSDGVFEALERTVRESGALFLLDGLDEARDGGTRSRLLEAVTEFSTTAGKQCRFLITSRPYAWQDVEEASAHSPDSSAAVANTYPRYTLAELDRGQRRQFTARWFRAVQEAGWIRESEATRMTANLEELEGSGDRGVQPHPARPTKGEFGLPSPTGAG